MKAEQLAVVQGWADTASRCAAGTRPRGASLRAWALGSLPSPRRCWPRPGSSPRRAVADPTALRLPRRRRGPADAARLRLRARPQRHRARAARAGLRRGLHRRLELPTAARDYSASAQAARPRRPAGDRVRRPPRRSSRCSPRPTRSATSPPTSSAQLGVSPARRCCSRSCRTPCRSCSRSSSRSRPGRSPAAAAPGTSCWPRRSSTTAVAIPLLVLAAAIETWVTPDILRWIYRLIS